MFGCPCMKDVLVWQVGLLYSKNRTDSQKVRRHRCGYSALKAQQHWKTPAIHEKLYSWLVILFTTSKHRGVFPYCNTY